MRELPVAKPWFSDEEITAVEATIRSGWVTQGPRVAELERAFAAYVGAPYACAVSSGTAALHLALLGVGVRPGDVVLTVSHSFIATANVVRYCGAEPIFLDIDIETLNLDPDVLARALSDQFEQRDGERWYRDVERLGVGESPLVGRVGPLGRLAAILLVHQVGMPADLDRILASATDAGVPVVEDAACAAGSEVLVGGQWERIGRPHGRVSCFSFHPRKLLTTGDGGMLTTADPELDQRFRLLRQHSMSVPDFARHSSSTVVVEEYLTTGFNYRLTDVQAAIGIVQLGRLSAQVERRRKLAARYTTLLADVPGVHPPVEPPWARSNWQSYVVWLDEPAHQIPVIQALKDVGISARLAVMNAHAEPPYRDAWPPGSLPASERARARGIVMPLFAEMTENDVERVVEELRRALSASTVTV